MPRITKVYTRMGDEGQTMLGSGAYVPKTSLRIAAYGTVDELNAQLGVVLSAGPVAELVEPLRRMQNELFHAGAELCLPETPGTPRKGPAIAEAHVTALEQLMDQLSERLPALANFVLPGGTAAASALHVARTVCRRAEREVLLLAEREPVGEALRKYLNRLSDALFVMSRYENVVAGQVEPLWDSRA